jgi:hypothetical protein
VNTAAASGSRVTGMGGDLLVFLLSFRGASKTRTRNLEVPGSR